MTVQAGQPTAIDCGSFTNIPTTNLDWEVQFGDMFERVNLANERATIGLNQSLYLLEPIAAETPFLFRCILRNTDLGDLANGYVRVTVQGMYKLAMLNSSDYNEVAWDWCNAY